MFVLVFIFFLKNFCALSFFLLLPFLIFSFFVEVDSVCINFIFYSSCHFHSCLVMPFFPSRVRGNVMLIVIHVVVEWFLLRLFDKHFY